MDPRNYQIAALSTFISIGVVTLGFQIAWINAVVIVAVALLAQFCLFQQGRSYGPYKSALISALSLVLLLRTDVVALAAVTALIAVASKRFLCIKGCHVFNPSAFALVVVTTLFPAAYLSPGQWGALGLLAFVVAGIGLLVVTRAQRLDVTLAFLGSYALIVFCRGSYLGDPPAIALHQLQSGALILFAFFMITDPKTTPASSIARVAFGVTVAVVSAVLQFYFFISTAVIYALVLLAPLVPVFNFYSRSFCREKYSVLSLRT